MIGLRRGLVHGAKIAALGVSIPRTRPYERGARRHDRHVRRVDLVAHRHPRAARVPARSGDLRPRRRSGQRPARHKRSPGRRRRPRDQHLARARHAVPGDRLGDRRTHRRRQRRRLRRAVGLHRLRVRARRRHRLRVGRHLRHRARDRRRGRVEGARLARPRHLRAVRRRRRRGTRAAQRQRLDLRLRPGQRRQRCALPQHAGRRHEAAGQSRDGRRSASTSCA